MKVALITPIVGKEIEVGMSRYTNVLINGLEKENERVISIPFSEDKMEGRMKRLTQKLFPIKALKQFVKAAKNETDIYHFICPELMYSPLAVLQMFIIKKLLRKKIVLSLHDLMTLEESEGQRGMNKLVHFFIKKLISYSDKIIVNSQQTAKEGLEILKIPKEKIKTVPLGIQKRFSPQKEFHNLKFVVGYYGPFDKVEDPIYAINCFNVLNKDHPNKFEMQLWGQGYELDNCIKTIKKFGLSNVTINGFEASDPQLKKYDSSEIFLFPVETYNSFDVFLFTSKYEGFGLNLGEAIACGVPTIIREEARITPELRKLCVVGKDERDIAKKIYKLSTNKKYKKQVVEKGLKEIKEFTWEKNFKGHLDVYRSLK